MVTLPQVNLVKYLAPCSSVNRFDTVGIVFLSLRIAWFARRMLRHSLIDSM